MQLQTASHGVYRRLWSTESDLLKSHLLRLDREARRMRFAHAVSDAFIESYVAWAEDAGGLVLGLLVDGDVKAAAELRKLGGTWGEEAEAAFSVEARYQDQGVGTALMTRLIRAARNRGVRCIHMCCLTDNARMQTIALKEHARLTITRGEAVADIIPAAPNQFTLLSELLEERIGFIHACAGLHGRLMRSSRS